MSTNAARYDALRALLALPDPSDLRTAKGITRGRCGTIAGDPLRKETLKRDAERAYLRYRKADYGIDESAIVSVRRSPLQLVRRRA